LSIVGRIRLFQAIYALAVTALAAFAYFDLRASVYYSERVQFAREQLGAISQLAIDANRYSEQIAELMLIGEPERPDFDSARAEVSRTFVRLRERTLREADFIKDPEERQEEAVEIERLDRMQALFREIDRAVERLLLLGQQGRPDQAIALFRSEIENRLDAEFSELIAEALRDEQEEVLRVERVAARVTNALTLATIAACVLFVMLTLISGMIFARSILRPVRALIEGAQAIERGDFDHRISHRGNDELAVLSRRFNAMAEQLGRQRAMLIDARSALERQVAERTEELAEANRRLIATDAQRVRLLTDISHELRTPLTALRGEAEIALRGASKPEEVYREALANVVARAADLARLVEDLLFLARSDAEEIRFDFQRVDLNALLAEAVQDAEVLGRQRGIRMVLEDGAGRLTMRADPRRIKQVMLIVLDNAAHYAQAGTDVAVKLRAENGYAVLTVADKGRGIAPEEVEQVFERFYRGRQAREEWEGGSGLGLPIARWIVGKHGGSIELASTLGQGTQVTLKLPLAA
jgi:two-component system, OmpR family, sensor kinase